MKNTSVVYYQKNSLEEERLSQLESLLEEVKIFEQIHSPITWDHTLNWNTDMKSWCIAIVEDELVGVASIFSPTKKEAEITLLVHPLYRRQNIGTQLLWYACTIVQEAKIDQILVVAPDTVVSAKKFIERFHANIGRSEYHMRMKVEKSCTYEQREANYIIREAQQDDVCDMARVCARAYNERKEESELFIQTCMVSNERTGYVGIYKEKVVAVCFCTQHPEEYVLHSIAVDPSFQRMGLGRLLIEYVLHTLRGKEISLEVSSTNTAACTLYQTIGFTVSSSTAYYALSEHSLKILGCSNGDECE